MLMSAWVREDYPYKQRWPHQEIPYYQIILSRDSVLCQLYMKYLALRARLVSFVKADSSPE